MKEKGVEFTELCGSYLAETLFSRIRVTLSQVGEKQFFPISRERETRGEN